MKGSCLCGELTYEIKSFSPGIANCHCSMCRKFHGAAYATYGTVENSSFKWLSGEDKVKTYVSSDKAVRGFCGNCGSSLFYKLRHGSNYEIALGTLDEEPNIKVDANIYYASKPKWSEGYSDLPKFNTQREQP